ncbi:MAG: aminotransferase class V-fold PLP-dependent enzyme, partial [bacterium]
MEKLIYLDNNATTKIDSRVLEKMLPYMDELYANPSSAHSFGLSILKEIDNARNVISSLINVNPNDLIFTSGSTESINLAIKGYALQNISRGNHIVSVTTEHKASLETLAYLEQLGFEISLVPVNSDGLVKVSDIEK